MTTAMLTRERSQAPAAPFLYKERGPIHDLHVFNKRQSVQSFGVRRMMNPNRLLGNVLPSVEGQFFRKMVRMDVLQSESGVVDVDQAAAEQSIRVALGKVLGQAQPGQTLQTRWSRLAGSMALHFELKGGTSTPTWRLTFEALDF